MAIVRKSRRLSSASRFRVSFVGSARHREIKAELAQIERNLREGEAWLPIKEQLRLKLRRFIEVNIPELTVQVRVEKRR
jgi:hypothetical protein